MLLYRELCKIAQNLPQNCEKADFFKKIIFGIFLDSEANIGQDGQRAQDTKDLFKVDQQACHFQRKKG